MPTFLCASNHRLWSMLLGRCQAGVCCWMCWTLARVGTIWCWMSCTSFVCLIVRKTLFIRREMMLTGKRKWYIVPHLFNCDWMRSRDWKRWFKRWKGIFVERNIWLWGMHRRDVLSCLEWRKGRIGGNSWSRRVFRNLVRIVHPGKWSGKWNRRLHLMKVKK